MVDPSIVTNVVIFHPEGRRATPRNAENGAGSCSHALAVSAFRTLTSSHLTSLVIYLALSCIT
jgi:hypothetical protein